MWHTQIIYTRPGWMNTRKIELWHSRTEDKRFLTEYWVTLLSNTGNYYTVYSEWIE